MTLLEYMDKNPLGTFFVAMALATGIARFLTYIGKAFFTASSNATKRRLLDNATKRRLLDEDSSPKEKEQHDVFP